MPERHSEIITPYTFVIPAAVVGPLFDRIVLAKGMLEYATVPFTNQCPKPTRHFSTVLERRHLLSK
jgi:hypothetical protein